MEVRNPLEHKMHKLMPRRGHKSNLNEVAAPMPGKVLQVHVKNGDYVQAGETLFILEAMKMQNVVSAHKSGIVQSLDVSEGQEVSINQTLLAIQ